MVGLVNGGFGTGGARVRPPSTKLTIHQTHHLMTLEEIGGDSNLEIVSFRVVCACLRACVRTVWLPSGIRTQKRLRPFPVSFLAGGSSPFSLV